MFLNIIKSIEKIVDKKNTNFSTEKLIRKYYHIKLFFGGKSLLQIVEIPI